MIIKKNVLFPLQCLLRIMETCQTSNHAQVGPQAGPVKGQQIDLTEDLDQQLEDIISTYQAAEAPAEPEDVEEVTAVKEATTLKDQRVEKKMLKNLGGFDSAVKSESGIGSCIDLRIKIQTSLPDQSQVDKNVSS